jgi:hypothetical protein
MGEDHESKPIKNTPENELVPGSKLMTLTLRLIGQCYRWRRFIQLQEDGL